MKSHQIFRLSALWCTLLLLVTSLGLTSCGMFTESYDNGDLDGLWIISQVDSLQENKSANIQAECKTWAFQAKLLQFCNQYEDTRPYLVMARFNHTDGMIIVSDPFVYNRMDGNVELTADSVHRLAPHFINCLPDTFYIEKLNKSTLRLYDDVVRLHFKKY
ncbi:MAG: lipocalin-like domain-containing protein [Bacteroidales bacterium]|nr:lipocalin-like domain-containing protein [Bacteroidales bacterium]